MHCNDHDISNKRNRIRNAPLALLFGHFPQLFTDLGKKTSTSMLPRLIQRHGHCSYGTPLVHFLVLIFEAIALCNAVVSPPFENHFICSE